MRIMPNDGQRLLTLDAAERAFAPHAHSFVAEQSEPSHEAVQRASASINAALQASATKVQFLVDDENGRTIVKVIDSETNELIRQIPSAEALEIARHIERMQGLLLHRQA